MHNDDDDNWFNIFEGIKKIKQKYIEPQQSIVSDTRNTYIEPQQSIIPDTRNTYTQTYQEPRMIHCESDLKIGKVVGCRKSDALKISSCIHAKLDLHGYTIAVAYNQLKQFIMSAYQNHKSNLLIITGKDSKNRQEASIQGNFIKWINFNEIRPYVLYFNHAKTYHGGTGAFYLLLRKNKNF